MRTTRLFKPFVAVAVTLAVVGMEPASAQRAPAGNLLDLSSLGAVWSSTAEHVNKRGEIAGNYAVTEQGRAYF
jgi:hypothetical protein